MRNLLPACVVALAAGCSGGAEISLEGRTLAVVESNFGRDDYFCPKLANGQFMVVLTDFPLCMRAKAGESSRALFHSTDETNLRLVFPANDYKRVPPENVFQVGLSDCRNSAADGTEAIAVFSHHTSGMADYDLSRMADSGTITVTYPNGYPNPPRLAGSYDLNFGGDNLKGTFDAVDCGGDPGVGGEFFGD